MCGEEGSSSEPRAEGLPPSPPGGDEPAWGQGAGTAQGLGHEAPTPQAGDDGAGWRQRDGGSQLNSSASLHLVF